MPLSMWNFDQFAANGLSLQALSNVAIQNLLGIPNAVAVNTASGLLGIGSGTVGSNTQLAGWLFFGSPTSNSNVAALTTLLSDLFDRTKSKSWFGFRTRVGTGQTAPPSTTSLIATTTTPNGTGATVLMTCADVQPTGFTVTQDFWVDVCLDWVNNQATIFVNGTQLRVVAVNLAAAGNLFIGPGAITVTGCLRALRDFYFLDDLGDGSKFSTRLGPIRTSLAPATVVSAPNYTLNKGSSTATDALSAFNTANPATPVDTPNVTNAITLDPLTTTFTSALDPNTTVLAVQYQVAVESAQANVGSLQAKAVQGSNNQVLQTLAMPDTSMRYQRFLGTITQAPDGSALSIAKVNATQLVLTPQT